MAEHREVIQEFLARLGFEVNQPSLRNFLSTLKTNCLSASKLAGGLVGVTVAAEAMAYAFGRSAEKMYYSSQRIRASAGNIQALEYGAKQIGLNVDDIRSSLEGLAAQMRLSPATGGILDMLGVTHDGRDRVEVLLDTVQKLKEQFPGNQYFIGAGFARSLGLDENTYLMMSDRIDELRQFYAERKRMQGQSGFDADAAAKAGQEYMREFNRLWEKLGILGDKIKIELLEPFKELNHYLSETLSTFMTWLGSEEGRSSIKAMTVSLVALGEGISNQVKAIGALKNFDLKKANEYDSKAFDAFMYLLGIGAPTPTIQQAIDAAAKGKGNLEFPTPPKKAAFPYGLLPSEFNSLGGNSMENLDFLYGELMSGKWNPKNRQKILGEMNTVLGGEFQGGKAPWEVSLGQNGALRFEYISNVVVNGAREPESVGRAVERANKRVMADAVRNLEGVNR